MARVRDYKAEYAAEPPERRKRRALRNKARRKMARKLGVAQTSIKGDIGHKDNNTKNHSFSNLKVESPKSNRGWMGKGGRKHRPHS